jgi:hypothetical protein
LVNKSGILAFVKLAEWADEGEESKAYIEELERIEGVYLVAVRWAFIYKLTTTQLTNLDFFFWLCSNNIRY